MAKDALGAKARDEIGFSGAGANPTLTACGSRRVLSGCSAAERDGLFRAKGLTVGLKGAAISTTGLAFSLPVHCWILRS